MMMMSPYSVFGVDVCSTVNEMLGTLAVSRPHSDMQRSAVQLRRGFIFINARKISEMSQNIKGPICICLPSLIPPLDGAKVTHVHNLHLLFGLKGTVGAIYRSR